MEDLPSNEREWYSFERQVSRWLSENVHVLTPEERQPFTKASINSIGIGSGMTILTNLTLNRFGIFSNRFRRAIVSSIGGIYVTTKYIASKRREIYTDLLKSPGTTGQACRKILAATRADPTAHTGYPQETHAPVDYSNFGGPQESQEFVTDNVNVPKETGGFFQEQGQRTEVAEKKDFKTWEEIRRENLKRDGYTQSSES
ncbi:conserved hypothetical protein [Theileria equi strain WA]|uniref:Uncharacterized protein n=1 Tax=Theileria equi strain WA TaxID=1537102 RepID=L1LE15_THEEQ|nr:conserved hypothetical protein [Theileria equi strain WA]EKX73524.1 conserved hypothetical protein [Theileria equi strain WA]|eukprot:XP_004832976.1 conserved hypothetical protein [Theileria equi strain WA]